MQKIGYLIIFLAIAIFIYSKIPRKVSKTIEQKIVDQTFSLEIADNVYLLAKGLSGRKNLCPKCGMLFTFAFETTQTFWMKDTLIPLDIIFINSNGQITKIFTANPELNKNDFELTLYQASAKYIIELNAGVSQKIGLKIGDQIDIKL
jgi:uncharacterized membrane protein (UPF0127 family)